MKKIFVTFLAMTLPFACFAQLKVDTNGNVGVGTSGTSFLSKLSVGSLGENGVTSIFSGLGTVTKVVGGTINSSSCIGSFVVDTDNSAPFNTTGIRADVSNLTNSNFNIVGVESYVAGSSSAKVVGVAGFPIVNNKGAGIFGSSSYPYYNYIDGSYAGFFYGNVKVTNGTINGTLTSSSDERLKEDMQEIADSEKGEDGSVISKLKLLTPISYRYKDTSAEQKERGTYIDKNGNEIELPEEEPNQVLKKRHFGFVAQELQQIYPDLVYEQDNGYLAVNYTELIPVLVQSIKELKAEVDVLKSAATKATRSSLVPEGGVSDGKNETAGLQDAEIAEMASMDQNMPNPFTEKTDIAIYLPESVKSATLYIYDLSGKQLEQHPVMGRGETVMTIHADKMNAGMYVYSLIADGKVVTTKKMIVVK